MYKLNITYRLSQLNGTIHCIQLNLHLVVTVFFLNISSAGRGSFIAGKAKNMHHRGALFRGQGGSGVRDMTPPLMGNLGAKSTSLILANLQAVEGGKKCCFRR